MTTIFIPLVVLGLWANPGERCATISPDQVELRCSSGTIISGPRSGPIELSADVWLSPASDGRGWVSAVLNGDIPADNHYVSAAIAAGIAPYWHIEEPTGVVLADGADHCCREFGRTPPGWHRLTVRYDGAERAEACVDGQCEQVRIALPVYWLQFICAGVSPEEPGSNPATCLINSIVISP